MKYITQIHPHSFIPSKIRNYEGIQWINDIPVAILDSGVYGYLSFSYLLPDDLTSNNVRYTLFWYPFVSGYDTTFNISSNLHNNVLVVDSSLLITPHLRKTIIEVPLTVSTPYEVAIVNLNSNANVFILGILVEGVE